METYTSPCVKTVGGKPLYNIGSSIPGSVTTWRGRMGRELRGSIKREGTYDTYD